MHEEELDGFIETETAASKKRSRDLDGIIAQHCLNTWGVLRGIDQLDSGKAVRILTESLREFMLLSPTAAMADAEKKINKLTTTARLLRAALMKTWGEAGESGGHLGSLKMCRVCGGRKHEHKHGCAVAAALDACKMSGLNTEGS